MEETYERNPEEYCHATREADELLYLTEENIDTIVLALKAWHPKNRRGKAAKQKLLKKLTGQEISPQPVQL